ncbi:glycoside hydrolase family 2 TIM barrel-domain containing protein [Mucilaginibacter gossypii]|uniref:exo-beta-1,4-galactosidase n=1 Tax=Mucilaginibacter gossypii TaxID=551996 RepID=UPI000DCC7F63|nr:MULTISPECIES: sugar-binding domain-containing protein [Mucilaginibacter]QTE38181.1 glycoside hydrolase family 2 TIM barrel-domain containing protein [Mucilaginibacter gossypii]RAV60346.1 beta-glucuronidase [Mucilaginibacter rubeus]
MIPGLVNNKYKFFKRTLICLGAGLGLLFCAWSVPSAQKDDNVISLAGLWQFQMDPTDKGIEEKWFLKSLADIIHLPGSMTQNLKGDDITLKTKWTGSIYDSSWFYNPRLAKYRVPGNLKIPFWLTPPKYYAGPAWYKKEVIIPADWKNKHLVLFLERAHTETRLWIDGTEIGMQNSLVAPHQYDLGDHLSPGKHEITLCIDNGIKAINVGPDSHSITDHTQGNWNGVIGKMELRAGSQTWLDDIQIYPDLKQKTAHIKIRVKTERGAVNGKITLSAKAFNSQVLQLIPVVSKPVDIKDSVAELTIDLPMGVKMQTWDEFNPVLYRLTATLHTADGSTDIRQVDFGMHEFKADGKTFTINGKPVFLRGTVNNCEFPLTGYPPTTEAEWDRIFKICREHGLNHMRFHSWCPPEAAFAAADKAGFYLHVEGPSWANHGSGLGLGRPIDQYIYDETNRMVKWYGNHPSFCMMAYGNEPSGKQVEYLTKFVDYWKAKDPRRLYTGAAVGGSWPVIPNNEYMARAGARGLAWNQRPESYSDYSKQIAQFNVPFVAHEMGQYCAFPDFKEIKKYTGIYKAKNFELFQEDLKDHGMADEAEKFLTASGKLQALCYKHEIEKAMRTPGYSGFQLLSLNDYPGQGTALVGVLNAFWDSKGYITAKQFARFCNATVPLIRTEKFVYQNNETLKAQVELFNYSKPMTTTLNWKLTDAQHKVISAGVLDQKSYVMGNCQQAGVINVALSKIKSPVKLNLEVSVPNTQYVNDWDFWVYPATLPAVKTDVYYTTSLDDKAKEVLNNGGKVFLNASGKVIKGKEIIQTFTPVFWNTSWFKMRPPHTLGFLCDPKHPAFNDFPTSSYSEIQWWDILSNAQVMHLEDFSATFRPVIQPIDTWFMNRRLALLFEARMGKGSLMVSSADLSPTTGDDRPAAKQLYYSILKYMSSPQFKPVDSIAMETVDDLFKTASKEVFVSYTNGAPDELKPKNIKK